MRRLLLGVAAMGLTLNACNTISPLTDAPVVSTQNTTIDEKVRYAAEAAYNIPAASYRSANERGLLSTSLKSVLKPKLIEMRKLLLAARAAYAVGDAATFNGQVETLFALREQVTPLLPK